MPINLVTELQHDPKTSQGGKREDLKQICIKILNRFGETMKFSTFLFYSIEKITLNLILSDFCKFALSEHFSLN